VRKLPTRKLLGALIAGALFLPNEGFTLGLGEIEVNSALNQKLNADIEVLSATPEDTETLIVKLASRKEFQRAGIDRPFELNDLRFKSVVIDNVPHITISSSSPIREPFLNFLIEVDWPNGHLLREYTVLLDPPVFMTQSANASSAQARQASDTADSSGFRPSSAGSTNVVPVFSAGVAASSRSATEQVTPQSDSVGQAPVNQAFIPAPMVQQQTSINQPPGSYRIKTGDTAWSLADAMRPDQSVTVEQMMIAMLRTNPESFIAENINGLKRGYILRLPDYDQIASVNQADARAMVREQAALWRQYQQSQAGGQPVSAMPTGDMSGSAEAGEGEAAAADAYLEIVSAGTGSSSTSSKDPTKMTAQELRAELALARERVETERVEKEALQKRVNMLEKNVDQMKGMLSIEDEELSGVQSLNALDKNELAALSTDESALDQATTESLDAESAEQAAADGITAEDMATEDTAAETAEGIAESTEEVTGGDAVFTDEGAAEDSAASTADEGVAEMPEQQPVDTGMAAEPEVAKQPASDPLSQLLNNPMLLAAATGGLLLIAALIGLIIKRRKTAAETSAPVMDSGIDELESLADDIAGTVSETEEVVVESLAGDQAAEEEEATTKFDSDATMVLGSAEDTVITEGPSAAAHEDEARDDVIAEADVYLAYGIYQQAEELLKQAIADNPDREDYRVKLAETYYASKNAEAFVDVASEIKKRAASDDTPAWKKVMVMGQDMCADNPMFQGSMVGGLDVGSLAPSAPAMDFDLGMDEIEENAGAPDLDLSLDDESIEISDLDEGFGHEMGEEEAPEETSFEEIDELEFDLSDTGAVEETAAAEDEFSLDIDASELDIDIQDESASVEAAATDEDSMELGDIDLGLDLETEGATADEITDIGDIDIEFGMEEESPAAEEEISLDLTDEEETLDIDSLDMGPGEELDTGTATASEETAEIASDAYGDLTDEEDFDLSSLDDVDEISTKLDLARAYLDMGDHEGTRSILEEVLAEGNDEQKEEANELMSKLD
jgi:pilus assembly protein FimV